MRKPKWILFVDKPSKKSILTPLEQRQYGLIHMLEGFCMLIMGRHAPSMTLPWISQKVQEKMEDGTHPAAK